VDKRPLPPRLLAAVDELAELVLGYLADHPHASDTLLGIAEWWVVRQQIRVDLDNLQLALDALTERGLLQKSGSGDQRRYRLYSRPGSPEVPTRGADPGQPHAPRR
jgi:hypothetical protein